MGDKPLNSSRSGSVMPLRRLRLSKGWSMERLAGISGVRRERIRAMEHNRPQDYMSMGLRSLCRLAIALECSPVDLLPFLAARPSKRLRKVIADDEIAALLRPTWSRAGDQLEAAKGDMPEGLEDL